MHSTQHTAGRRLISSAEFKTLMGGISEMSRWRRERAGIGPQPVKVGRRNYYLLDEVTSYLDQLAACRPDGDDVSANEIEDNPAERTAAQNS